jgi:hypothetical protein
LQVSIADDLNSHIGSADELSAASTDPASAGLFVATFLVMTANVRRRELLSTERALKAVQSIDGIAYGDGGSLYGRLRNVIGQPCVARQMGFGNRKPLKHSSRLSDQSAQPFVLGYKRIIHIHGNYCGVSHSALLIHCPVVASYAA